MEYLVNGKAYKTMEEAKKAEEAVALAEKEKAAKKNELTVDLKTVNDAANHYFEVVAANKKQIEELEEKLNAESDAAYAEYKKALNDFAEKHDGYRLTYRNDGKNVEFKIVEAHEDEIEERINREIERQREFFKNFWINF